MSLAALQALALLLGGIYNSLLTYEAYKEQKKMWRIIASGATSLLLFSLSGFRFGAFG